MKAKTRKRDKLMKTKNIAFTIILLSCVAFIFTAQADPPGRHVVTQFHQTVLGTMTVNGELVDFSGMIHVVADVQLPAVQFPPDPCRVHANLSDVVGIGRDTGGTYHAEGATDSDFMVDLSEGLSLEADYLIPEAPPDPCRVFINIAFDQSGNATALSAVIGSRQ